jgi:hypothetical protein
MSNQLPEKSLPKPPQPEEHKLNALSKEFQTSLFISQPHFSPPPMAMPYQNYYPNYQEINYGYTPYNYGIPYKYGGMNQPSALDFYQNEKPPFV